MLNSSLPPDTTPQIHQLKRRGCLEVTVSDLGARAIGPVASFKFGIKNYIMAKHVKSKDTHCMAARTPKQNKTKKRRLGFQRPFPQHTHNDLTSSVRKLPMTKTGWWGSRKTVISEHKRYNTRQWVEAEEVI